MRHSCPQCNATFSRSADRNRHVLSVHTRANLAHTCGLCGGVFTSVSKLKKHRASHEPSNGFAIRTTAFNKKCVIYRKTYNEKMETLEKSFKNDRLEMYDVINFELNQKRSIKAAIIFHAEFLRPLDGDLNNVTPYVVCLRCSTQQLTYKQQIPKFLTNAKKLAQNRIDDFVENGSGWVLDEVYATDIELGSCTPLNGSCDFLSINYIKSLQKIPRCEKGENQCFFLAVAHHFVSSQNTKCLKKFIERKININITSPVRVNDIKKFEKANSQLHLRINVLYAEDKEIYPLIVSTNLRGKNVINLLLYKTIFGGKVTNHYAYIRNVSSLLRRTYQSKTGRTTYQKSEHCPNCLTKFTSRKSLQQHIIVCLENQPQKVKLPQEGDSVYFKNFNRKFPMPFFGVFDFEACQVKPKNPCHKCVSRECQHQTTIASHQIPITYSYVIVETRTEKIIKKETFSGDNCAISLVNSLLDIEPYLLSAMNAYPELQMTKEDLENFKRDEHCHICESPLNGDKVRDHCHVSGKYLGAAHNHCNLNRTQDRKIPMYCHNLAGYDSHFIMLALNNNPRIKQLEGLPSNTEKFKTIQINSFVLLDSLAFLNASLSELVSDLSKNKQHQFTLLNQMGLYKNTNGKLKKLLIRKGCYPYEAVSGLEMLKTTKKLPPRKDFYSSLTDSTVTVEDYKHASRVFRAFKCKNMLEYTEIYCQTDVALLAEVILQFRKVIQEEFGLDCWYVFFNLRG